jgi:hypothetical protein
MRREEEFRVSVDFGRMGERLVARWLQSRGWGVVPSYDYTGSNGDKAPRLMFETHGFSVPDLDACKDGARRWLEVKAYHGPGENERLRSAGKDARVHAIIKRHFNQYLEVERQTGTAVVLAILELDSGVLLKADLARLSRLVMGCQCQPCEGRAEGRCRAPIKNGVYWPRAAMFPWHQFGPVELRPIRQAHAEMISRRRMPPSVSLDPITAVSR